MRAYGLRILTLAVLILSALTGCGQKGPNRPLALPLPSAPANAAIAQKGNAFVLSWDIPQTNQNGTPLTDLEGFRVLKRSYVPGDECPECRDPSVPLVQLDLEYLRGAQREGERIILHDAEVSVQTGYRYRIVPVTRKGRDGAAATLERVCYTPPAPPTGLKAEGLDRLVRLQWDTPSAGAVPGTLAGYRIYRKASGESVFSPLNQQPKPETRFEDFGRDNDQPLSYAVTTLSRQGGELVESALSEPVTAVPKEGF